MFRFAGTWNAAAVAVLSRLTQKLHAVTKRSLADLTGRAVIEQELGIRIDEAQKTHAIFLGYSSDHFGCCNVAFFARTV